MGNEPECNQESDREQDGENRSTSLVHQSSVSFLCKGIVTYSQSRRPHQRVAKNPSPRTKLATFEATISNPPISSIRTSSREITDVRTEYEQSSNEGRSQVARRESNS
jgi:hypothetical protein